MSAFDIGARALALRAIAESAQTFATVSQAALPASINALATSGYSAHGLGAGLYVCDALATAALAAAHPLAVFAAAGGRYFRLAGDAEGFITPEQFGCGAYAAGTNQQPAIQAAINYCKAVGLKGVKFTQSDYELWVTPRVLVGAEAFDSTTNHTGNYIVIDQFACTLLGLPGARTTLRCKGPTGGSTLTDYQVFNSTGYGGQVIWRGSAIKLTGNTAYPTYGTRPAESLLSHLSIKDIVMLADAVGVRNPAWPCWPLTRDPTGVRQNCWDITNKGVYAQNNVHTGDVYAENFDLIGFLGECYYTPGWRTSSYILRNCTVKNSNGQALNPNGNRIWDIDGFYAENCGMAMEGWHGTERSRIVNAYFKDCNGTNGGLAGGGLDATGLRADGSPPAAYMDVTFENCAQQNIGSFTTGKIKAIDTSINLYSSTQTSPTVALKLLTGVNIDIDLVAHTKNVGFGISGRNEAGSLWVAGNTVRLRLSRTPNARTNGFGASNLVTQGGSLGPDNYIYLRGDGVGKIGFAYESPSTNAITDNYAALIDDGLVFTSANHTDTFDPTTTPSPPMGALIHTANTFSGGNGVWPVNLPAVDKFPHGAQVRVRNRGSALQFIEIVDTYDGKRCIIPSNGYATFRANKIQTRWEMIFAPKPLTATASIAITSTALGAESGPYTIALTGCRPWHRAEVIPPSLMTGFGITAVRADTDQVKFWAKNYDGANPATLAALTYTARCWVAPN